MSNNPMDQVKGEDRRPVAWRGARSEWRTTPPGEPGWYWARRLGVTELVSREPEGAWSPVRGDNIQPMKEYTHWLGPLPVPQPPKE